MLLLKVLDLPDSLGLNRSTRWLTSERMASRGRYLRLRALFTFSIDRRSSRLSIVALIVSRVPGRSNVIWSRWSERRPTVSGSG